MSNSAAAQEPSMEEILASIRRIITDEQGDSSADSAPDMVSEASNAVDSVSAASEKEDETVSGGEAISAEDLDALFASDEPASEEFQNETVSEDDLDALFGSSAAEVEPEPEPEPAPEPAADEDVMELTEAEMAPDDDLDIVEGMDIMFAEEGVEAPAPVVEVPAKPEVVPEPAMAPPPLAVADVSMDEMEALVSDQAASSVSNAFANLSGMVVSSQAKSMEDLMKEMLRPMLQSWLDQNLPPLVEKMVASEIRRLSGK
ncbi:MAG: PopZ family protein [Hyphomicrobiales bacterium]